MTYLNRQLLLVALFVFRPLHPELRSLWHHRNNLSLDDNRIIWRKQSSKSSVLQLLVPKSGREQLFLAYHASLFGGHLGRNRTLACLAHRFYWSGMSDDVKEWLTLCVACVKKKISGGTPSSLGKYSDRSSLGSYSDGYFGRLRPDPRWSPLHLSDCRLFQQMDRCLPHE